MTTPEHVLGAGDDLSHGFEAKTLLSEFRGFADDLHDRLRTQDQRMTLLDRKMAQMSRPHLAADAQDLGAPHQKAFAAYIRSGDETGMRGLEGKAMTASVAADGGVLVTPQVAEQVRAILVSTVSIRSIASVVHVDSGSLDVLIDRGEVGAGWATETAAATETGTGILEKVTVPLHELAAQPKASQRLIDDSAFDVDAWLAERIAERFARAESNAFVVGNGVDKPRGFLNYPAAPNATAAWGQVGYVATGTAGGLSNIDPIVDLVYALGSQYRANATFVMNSKTTALMRKLKDADGRFLWADSLQAGEPPRLMGYRVLICEDMPDIAGNSHSVAFGDFGRGYTVAERPDLRVLRDPYSAKPHVLFFATKRVGGAVTDFAAIKTLRFAVS